MIKSRRIVKATKIPHDWKRNGAGWKCATCGARAAEFDDFGDPEPYASVVYGSKTLELVELTCEEYSVFKVMED